MEVILANGMTIATNNEEYFRLAKVYPHAYNID
jgi:hypothetical protein